MESRMIIISIVLIALCILPILYIIYNTQQKDSQLKKGLKSGVEKQNGNLTDFVIHNNFAIGIDEHAKQVYFYKNSGSNEEFKTINVYNNLICSINTSIESVRSHNKKEEHVLSVSLCFSNAKSSNIESFELFNCDESFQLTGEIDVARVWKKKIDDLIIKQHTDTSVNRNKSSHLTAA